MAGPGRPKGAVNKISAQVKENVVHVFEQLGGVKKMTAWANENLSEFYRLYGRLLPTEATVNLVHEPRELSDADLANIATRGGEGTDLPPSSPEKPSQLH